MKRDYKYVFKGLAYLKKYWLKLIFILLMSVITISLSLVPVEIFRRLIDIAIPAKDLQMVMMMVGIVFGVHLLLLMIYYIQDLMLTKMGLKVRRRIQIDFFKKLFHLSSPSKLKKGQLMERMIDDTEDVVNSTFDLILSPILNIISLVIVIIYMFLVSPRLTFVVLGFVPIFILLTVPFNHLLRKKYTSIKERYADVFQVIQDKLSRLNQIARQRKIKKETKELDRCLEECNIKEYDFEKFSIKIDSAVSVVGDLAPYVILLYATYEIIQGRFQIGTLVAFSMLTPRLLDPVRELADSELELQTLAVTTRRVFGIFRDKKKIIEGELKLKELKTKKKKIFFK